MEKRTGRVALVTGGAQGIGRGIAQRLWRDGMTVIVADRDEKAAAEWLAEMGRPTRLYAVTTDVTREDDVARMVAEAVRLGGRLDALVNNVGIGVWKPIETMALDEWNRVLATNLTSVFLAVKYASPHLRASRGAVVNIASTRALQSERNGEAYAASKGGMVSLTHALAVSLGPDVRVNAISPGWIEVRDHQQASRRVVPVQSDADRTQHPVGRVGVPEDIASMVGYLLSQEAGFITGQNFVVDGGMTKKMIYV